MKKNSRIDASFFTQWIIFLLVGVLALREFYLINIRAYVPIADLFDSRRFIAFLFACSILFAIWVSYFFLAKRNISEKIWRAARKLPIFIKTIFSIIALLLPGLVKWILPLPADFDLQSWIMIFSFLVAGTFTTTLFFDEEDSGKKAVLSAVFFMVSGFGYAFFARMDHVTSYPFTLYWSEGNRFFDYSTLLGSKRYIIPDGEEIKAFINWGMALPWALPFALPKISIGVFRLWYQLVWIIPAMLLGFFAVNNRKKEKGLYIALVFAFWAFLFTDQGPIYSPLIIGAIVTVIAARQRIPIGAVLIIAASYYVRRARWTWGYVPGLWAGMLALLAIENPSLKKDRLKDLIKPLILGLAGYFGGHLLPSITNIVKNNSSISFLPDPTQSVTRQTLLWERLWPNPTYPPGIMLGLMWAVLPVIMLVMVLIIKRYWKLNWIQNVSWIAVCGAILAAGIVASTKIGGGSNLHNLDMFLISMLLMLASAINRVSSEEDFTKNMRAIWAVPLIICLIAPVTYTLQKGERLELPKEEKITESINAVQNKIEEYSTQGPILFIDHRQLLTFDLVKNVPLIDEYEKKYLMDYALSDNAAYFSGFYEDLADERFTLIVNEPTNIISRGSEYSFGEENDAYVKWVTVPLLCKYEPLYTSQPTALELLIPRTSPAPSYLHCDAVFAELNE